MLHKLLNRNIGFSFNNKHRSLVWTNTLNIFNKNNRKNCSFVQEDKKLITQTPLSKALPGFPTVVYPTLDKSLHETKVTTLSNGLRVASEPKFGQFCTVGVVIDSGSRYEVFFKSGISHFLEKLSFNSTEKYESKDHILQNLEKHGGICDCQGSRDSLIYAASIDSRGLETIVDILSEVVLRPTITDKDLETVRQIISFELEDISMRPDQEQILMELIHAAAYRSNTLGLPKICPEENIDKITKELIYSYLSIYHDPSRIVLAGVGVEHDKLVNFAQKYFVDSQPIWKKNESLKGNFNIKQADKSLAQYTGGIKLLEKDLSNVCPGPSQIPELVHFVLGFESSPYQDLHDFIPTCVLNMMMGGGGSFSAGGPGKGMYTRLYTNVLNRHYWMYNATAYNHGYMDSGLFCIHASADPSQIEQLVGVITKEAREMNGKIDEIELKRAKAQLQSMLLMNLEARPVIFEDVARQVLANNHRKSAQFFLDEIDKITDDDIRRIVTKMLKSKVSVAALGNVKAMPSVQEIESQLLSSNDLGKRFRLFR